MKSWNEVVSDSTKVTNEVNTDVINMRINIYETKSNMEMFLIDMNCKISTLLMHLKTTENNVDDISQYRKTLQELNAITDEFNTLADRISSKAGEFKQDLQQKQTI